jgi:CheY-like chemotaxis protein
VCDADKLKQVLINLVGNALKFTARGGITVALQVDPQSRRPRSIQVADTGIGIPPERQEAIFEAFTQADSGTARTYGGTGLGLTISRSLCQRMGWELTVASQVGQGSTFTILLSGEPGRPAQPSAATPAVPASSHSDPGRRLVLAIDDDPDACLLLSRYAEEAGCQVITASSGPQGLRLARERRPALILLDLLMPHTNGWEVLHLLKADPALRDIPIVVISVVGNESRGTVLEAVEVIDKPFTRADLLCVLQRNLGDQPVSSAP